MWITRDDLVRQLADRAARRPRVLAGLAGAPGSGKSTIAAALASDLSERGIATAVVPMDGFHLADVTLDALGRLDRKGAPDTFDGDGFVALLRRLRAATATTVYAPGFDRGLEQPLAAAITVPADVRVVITEGNYLLVPAAPWRTARELLDLSVFVVADDAVRRERLLARHVQFGKSPAAARDWVDRVDEPNAELVATTQARATWSLRT